jgi:hypothetical protein
LIRELINSGIAYGTSLPAAYVRKSSFKEFLNRSNGELSYLPTPSSGEDSLCIL